MTVPTQMNCSHQGEGWCLQCVGELAARAERLRNAIEEIEQVGHNPADLASDLIGLPNRYEQLASRLAAMAHAAMHKDTFPDDHEREEP